MKAIRKILACIRTADQRYNLINHGDKIVVGLSGGKDSVALLYSLSLYKKFSHTDFTLQPVMLDLGFDGFSSYEMNKFCDSLGLKLIVHDSTEVYKILKIQQKDSPHLPCSICSRMKKAAINKVANEIGFNKVAFGHHFSDAIETLFMNEIYGGRIATFSPKMCLERVQITFIRPLVLAEEKEISRLIKEEKLPTSSSHCPADKNTTREDIKELVQTIYHKFPKAKENFLTMLDNYEHIDLWGNQQYIQIDQEGLCLKRVLTHIDFAIVVDIRQKVFVNEQQISPNDEFILEEEYSAHTFLIYKDLKPIGTIRYSINDQREIHVSRFAILNEYRKFGYGRKVFTFFCNKLAEKYNPCTIKIEAQYYLKDFYRSIGFIEDGEKHLTVGIEHIDMIKICK